jgi:hypothetical protein
VDKASLDKASLLDEQMFAANKHMKFLNLSRKTDLDTLVIKLTNNAPCESVNVSVIKPFKKNDNIPDWAVFEYLSNVKR